MFSDAFFRSWLFIIVGGACFAGIFSLIVMMSEVLFFEGVATSAPVKGIFMLSFFGYVGLAWVIRSERRDGFR
jgi:hypothetical protein